MPLQKEIELRLRRIPEINEISELKHLKNTVFHELEKTKKIKEEFLFFESEGDYLSIKNKILFSALKTEYPRMKDIDAYLEHLQRYIKLIDDKISNEKPPLTFQKLSLQPTGSGGKIRSVIEQFNTLVKNNTVTTTRVEGKERINHKDTQNHRFQFQFSLDTKHTQELHKNIEKSDVREGFLLTQNEISAVRKSLEVAWKSGTGKGIVKLKRVRGKKPEQLQKFSDLEKTLGLNYSVLVTPQEDKKNKLIALYKGKNHLLGGGQYGSVKLGQDLDTGEWVAVKIEKVTLEEKKEYKETKETKNEEKNKREREFEISKELGLQKSRAIRTVSGDEGKIYNILTLLEGHSLEVFFDPDESKRKGIRPITDFKEKLDICIKILSNVRDLHKKNILHRDFHPGNFMYDPIKKETIIIDFGDSIKLKNGQNKVFSNKPLGLFDHYRPELNTDEVKKRIQEMGIIEGIDLNLEYSKASDLFQLSFTIGNILTNYGNNLDAVPEKYGEELADLLDAMKNLESKTGFDIEKGIKAFQNIKNSYEKEFRSRPDF